MTPLKQFTIGKLVLIALIVGVACGTTQAVTTSTPTASSSSSPASGSTSVPSITSTPAQTPVPSVKLPDDARSLFEAWRIIMQDFVEIEELDPRVLSDGAIFGLLDVLGDDPTGSRVEGTGTRASVSGGEGRSTIRPRAGSSSSSWR